MKKIGCMTFHAAHNFGSVLQAFALQEFFHHFFSDYTYEIINFRTQFQKEKYKSIFEKKDIKSRIKQIIMFNEKNNISLKKERFEKFINNRLNVTKEFDTLESLEKETFKYDYYLCGSDQIWNIKAPDFNWAYLLEFASGKKISYAASFGPSEQIYNNDTKERMIHDLKMFNSISVREKGSYDNVYSLTNISPSINIDPTMLLTKSDWDKIICKERLINHKYILLYDLKRNKNTYKIAKYYSRKMKIPVVLITGDLYGHLKFGFEHYYSCGPEEFLNLIKNAELVLSSSFHGNVFSVLFEKDFYAINGLNDMRLQTFLDFLNLKNRNINLDNYKELLKEPKIINYEKVKEILEIEKKKTINYFEEALK